MTVSADIACKVTAKESKANAGLGNSNLFHVFDFVANLNDGTVDGQIDVVYSTTSTATASPDTYDVLGGLNSQLDGSVLSFVDLCGIFVRVKTSTPGTNLVIGGGSNPIVGPWIATGDGAQIGPAGMFVWFDPIDGIQPAAGTGDTLTIDPGAGTVEYDLLLLGRSA